MDTKAINKNGLAELLANGSLDCGSLGYHALQPNLTIEHCDNLYGAARAGMIIGDPLGDISTLPKLTANERFPDFLQISLPVAQELRQLDYRIAAMGVEAIVSLPFTLSGERKADLRRAKNLAHRRQVIVSELSQSERIHDAQSITAFNRHWLSSRRIFKSEFTLLARPFSPDYRLHERRFVARIGGRIVGLACYDPMWTAGEITGYLEAIVRTDETAAPGARDALTLTALEVFQSEGVSELSLGLCPFYHTERTSASWPENASVSAALFKVFYRYGNSLFNSRGLAFHKSRYRPHFIPLFVASRRRSPFSALYRACCLSGINPAFAARRALLRMPLERRRIPSTKAPSPALDSPSHT